MQKKNIDIIRSQFSQARLQTPDAASGVKIAGLDHGRGVDRVVDGMSTAIAGVVLTATLTVAMQMGFSRADEIKREYWPDIPLLITA